MSILIENILAGDPKAIARMITMVERNDPGVLDAMKTIHRHIGNAHILGITGTMGTGKSTLIGALAREYRREGKQVGIVGIDPTSWFSGGALLGDRFRMQDLATDHGVFIRSMGTRGTLGGLTTSIYDVVAILDASGKDVVMVETVGVGQSEIDIVKMADTTIVVTVPGLGDSIQAIKAGITEIADIFVVNKGDNPGADGTVIELELMLNMGDSGDWKIPVKKTMAKGGNGITELRTEITNHMAYLTQSGMLEMRRGKRYENELIEIIKKRLITLILDESKLQGTIKDMVEKISKREVDPHSAAEEILGSLLK